MFDLLDRFLNNITMYRLVFYSLIGLLLAAGVLSALGLMPYSLIDLAISAALLLAVGVITNGLFAKAFNVPANVESVYITAMILALIISPAKTLNDYIFLALAAAIAMAGKFILAINKKHIFNPAAISVALTALLFNQYASWWVATAWMLPFVAVAGFLIVKKIQRWSLVLSFLVTVLVCCLGITALHGGQLNLVAKQAVVDSPLIFFAAVMLTEPLTTPPTRRLQIVYGILVGILFAPQVRLWGFRFSPEQALVAGNIFSYLVSPKQKLLLTLKQKLRLAPDIYNFTFAKNKRLSFRPGQYLEWTLPPDKSDSRGNRRYFTIASSPTEADINMGVKFYAPASSFKKSLFGLRPGQNIVAGQLAGDFTLPPDKQAKLVFIAGGIGITPFRSMVKYLVDKNERRDIIIFYANKSAEEIVYQDIWQQAESRLGIKTVYVVTQEPPPNYKGEAGRLNEEMVKRHAPDFRQRHFYISGPRSMITGFKDSLNKMGVPAAHIKTDFFPGFA